MCIRDSNTKANDEPAKALIAELEKAAAAGCEKSAEILKSKQYICLLYTSDRRF